MHARFAVALLAALGLAGSDSRTARNHVELEAANPVRPLPAPPLGIGRLDDLTSPPSPERVRLGRWLFYDTRLSADGTISCATCHVPERAFSNGTRVAKGARGHAGVRKTPSSLEEQSLRPVANSAEMGSTPSRMVGTLSRIAGYARYFQRAFGDPAITRLRVASALADYQRTRMSGGPATVHSRTTTIDRSTDLPIYRSTDLPTYRPTELPNYRPSFSASLSPLAHGNTVTMPSTIPSLVRRKCITDPLAGM